MFLGAFDVGIEYLLDCIRDLRPSGWIVWYPGNGQLGERRGASEVCDLAANNDSDTVIYGVGDRHGRAYGVAVTAVHALFELYLDALLCGVGADGAGWA
ncbi:hypothetical protein MBAV_004179 [Candidatus Magnetobacterium bavaricum]|uniref:Uncharacterized protein n=1 Tax=Candidatus Magnetobacterium bavaricum TaxID=29290 RepID=A0A0F3GP84_9BACT|nr:hypothetical protein MBAV_004179 [Candidatus Magnetobacterium bavaricum]